MSKSELRRLNIQFEAKIKELEARLAAHIENEGDECPLCVCEAENERRPDVKVSDGDVWLVFPNATVSIEHICSHSGPLVRSNLRKWRDALKESE